MKFKSVQQRIAADLPPIRYGERLNMTVGRKNT